jgi:hypothetical protein
MTMKILIVLHQSALMNNGGDALRGRDVKRKDISNYKEL